MERSVPIDGVTAWVDESDKGENTAAPKLGGSAGLELVLNLFSPNVLHHWLSFH